VKEYDLRAALEREDERAGRHNAVRGLMVRLGVYPEFCEAVESPQPAASDVPHDVVRALIFRLECLDEETQEEEAQECAREAIKVLRALATPAPSTSTEEALRDTDRLNWLIETGAHLSWTKDSEMCRVWFPEQWDGSEARAATEDQYADPRQAIDAALSALSR
jgi:hypothetical protein